MTVPTISADVATHPSYRQQHVSRVPYLPGLDGLRALAVIAVIVYHANHGWLPGGFLGVEVFFVISGYLITLLLVAEQERSGRISLRQFWLRRARRLLPALYTMMAAVAVYLAFFDRRQMGRTRGDFLGGLFYVSNWYQIWVGQGYTSAADLAPLRHLWSLAVEEQFYLVWPIVMLLLLRQFRDRVHRLAPLLLLASIVVTAATAAMYIGGDVATTCAESAHGYLRVASRCVNVDEGLYLGTFSRAGGLLMGAAFALVWRPVAVMRSPLRRRSRTIDVLALVGLAGLVVLCATLYLARDGDQFGQHYSSLLFQGGFTLTGACTVLLIAAATHRRSKVGRLLSIRPLHWVGSRSYGLYLYHWPVYQILREPGRQLTLLQAVCAWLITLPVTELSYRLIETPVRSGWLGAWFRGGLRPRGRRARHRRRRAVVLAAVVAVGLGYSTVSIATAQVLCVGLECDFQAGDQVVVAPVVTVPPPVTVAPTVPPNTNDTLVGATTSVETTTTLPPGPADLLPVVAVGESVMLGAAPQLAAGGIQVNAAVSRQGTNVADVVALMRAAGGLGRTVVVQTGTNGSVSDETLARIMAALPADQTPLVVFLTVKAPKGWIADNNTRIRNLPAAYPNVRVVDWEAAAQQIAGELSTTDGGVHLRTPAAKQFYANLIFDAIGRPDLKK